MISMIEYALMAGRAYQSTRADINKFSTPNGWNEPLDERKILPSGFEAGYFQRAWAAITNGHCAACGEYEI